MPYTDDRDERQSKYVYSDDELLSILRSQREQSVGFELDDQLNADRALALNYYKGEMPDLPAQGNRSRVVSTDVADAIETALPDLIDIFLSGEDGLTFRATGHEDEEAAKQETDYVRHVIFEQNAGFRLLYTAFKDALLMKVGVFHYYWDPTPEVQEYETIGTALQIEEMQQLGNDILDVREASVLDGVPLYRITIGKVIRNGRVRIECLPPEDFTVAADTVDLADAPYCACRKRVRLQQLLADGYDAEKLAQMNSHASSGSDLVEQARDLAHESQDLESDPSVADELRTVEIIEHYVRLDLEGTGQPQIWRIVTGSEEQCILAIEKRSRIEFAAITPYPQPHRFYGQSLADKQCEIQRIQTVLQRMMLDAGYFAHNPRFRVKKASLEPETLSALVENEPSRPIIVREHDAVQLMEMPHLSFPVLDALEYVSTVAEQRSGIVRNAQGLNPDTLHDTAGGAKMLIEAAQKRLRLMARLFAETGIRDLFLGVHDLLRSNATVSDTVRLRNKWVQVDPQSWSRRKDMSIEIGVGSGGRDERAVKMLAFADRVSGLIEMQGGPNGPLVTTENIYQLAQAVAEAMGIKAPERFISNPAEAPPQEPAPDPAMLKAQGEQQAMQAKLQMQQQEAMQKLELEQMRAEAEARLQASRLQADHEAMKRKAELEAELARQKMIFESEMARERMMLEIELAREKMRLEAELSVAARVAKPDLPENRPGGSLAE